MIPFTNKKHLNELKQIWNDVNIITYRKDKLIKRVYRYISKILYVKSLVLFSRSISIVLPKLNPAAILPYFEINGELIKRTRSLLNEKSFDFVQIEHFEFLSLINYLPKSINTIFVHHELRFIRLKRELELCNIYDSTYANLLVCTLKSYEIEMLNNYHKIITVSDLDKNIIQNYCQHRNIYSSPLTIFIEKIESNEYSFNNTLVYLGGSSTLSE